VVRYERTSNPSERGGSGCLAENRVGHRGARHRPGVNSCLHYTARIAGALVFVAVFIFAPASGSRDALLVLSGGMIDSTGALVPKATRTVEGRLCFGNGLPCLSSSHVARFSVSSANTVLDGDGMARGFLEVRPLIGHTEISMVRKGQYGLRANRKGPPVASHRL
jgi:hypothetical protein